MDNYASNKESAVIGTWKCSVNLPFTKGLNRLEHCL